MLFDTEKSAISKVNSNTKSHAFQSDGRMACVWKRGVIELSSVKTVLVLLLPTKCVPTRKMIIKWPKKFSSLLAS